MGLEQFHSLRQTPRHLHFEAVPLAAHHQIRERRDQLTHPAYTKPELLATGPNQVWSWDITKLKGPTKWNHFQLYVIIDTFSRCVVGWMLVQPQLKTNDPCVPRRPICEAISSVGGDHAGAEGLGVV